jgi:hypothetical protein
MDQAVENAIARRNELRVTIERLQAELIEIEGFLSLYERFSGAPVKRGETADRGESTTHIKTRRRRLPPAELAEMASEIILAVGRPMTRGEIATALEGRNVLLWGGDAREKAKYLGTILWRRNDRFVNFEGHGYWPIDRPYEPAGYKP